MLRVEDVEKEIYINSEVNGIRISDRFTDFDRLRSGFVTVSQFSRILNGLLNIKLTEKQISLLAEKYSEGNNNLINYPKFCNSIRNIVLSNKYFASERTENQLNIESEMALTEVITRLCVFYEKSGFNVYQAFKNFDTHNIGRITENQFYRAFKKPDELKEEELALIVSKYRNKIDCNLINYMNFCHDVATITNQLYNRNNKITDKSQPKQEPTESPAISSIVDKIKMSIFTNRIRSKEFFEDYDKLRSGMITKQQFKSALYRICGKELGLTEEQLECVSFLYKNSSGKVNYREFCNAMENVFINPNLETCPTSCVYRPCSSQLAWKPHEFENQEEEAVIQAVLDRIATVILKRRLPMNVYFKDFDMGVKQSCLMSKSRFYRSLNNFGIVLNDVEMELIYKKYGDSASGWVHYRNFLIDVDKSYNQREENIQQTEERGRHSEVITSNHDSLLSRIQKVVYNRQVRIKEFFQEFDELRHGTVTKDQFRRLLSQLGFSKLGVMDISNEEFNYLCTLYGHDDFIYWTIFADDVNKVFGPTVGETTRSYSHQVEFNNMEDYQQHLVSQAFKNIKKKAHKRGLNVRPTFRDLDKLNSGYITRSQFGQCLSLLEIDIPQSERESLEILFCNDRGFNYESFLAEIDPIVVPEYMYPGLVEATQAANAKKAVETSHPTNLKETTCYIRNSIKNRDFRLSEFMEKFDKHNHGMITTSEFKRAVDSLGMRLDDNQLATIVQHYQHPNMMDKIKYKEFCQDTEYGLSSDMLEKYPLISPQNLSSQFKSHLGEEQKEACERSLHNIATRVRQRRIDIFPLFRDFDVNNIGTITKSQFLRCCETLELKYLINPNNEDVVCEMFGKKVGGRVEIDYVNFCNRINSLAGFQN